MLSARHKEMLDYYYNQDLSLAEIAQLVGISRQGVRDGIKKAEEELFFLEERVALWQKTEALRQTAEVLLAQADEPTARAVRQMLRAAQLTEEEGV